MAETTTSDGLSIQVNGGIDGTINDAEDRIKFA